jgi:WhiB family redox-sensing transcriptional regulator
MVATYSPVWLSDDGEPFLSRIARNVPAWTRDATCLEHPEVTWFPEKGESMRAAMALCASCLVQAECLGFALRERIPFGVWGGSSPSERRKLARRGITADAIEQWGVDAVAGAKRHAEGAAFDRWFNERLRSLQ